MNYPQPVGAMPDIATTVPTITSVELVEIINDMREEGAAELRHDNFMAKIEKHPGIQSPKFLGDYKDSRGRKQKCYRLPKREAELMVMSESLAVQTKVYDRMTALEQQAAAPASQLTATVEAAKAFPHLHQVAILLGCDTNAAAISANQGTLAVTGVNLLALMGLQSLPSPEQTIYLTPTELGKRCNPPLSAVKVNQRLAAAGLQKNPSGHWEPTEQGRAYSRTFDTGKRHNSGVPVQQVKWKAETLDVVEAAQ